MFKPNANFEQIVLINEYWCDYVNFDHIFGSFVNSSCSIIPELAKLSIEIAYA